MVARLLLKLSSDVTATDDEAIRAFSTGSSSFDIPNVYQMFDFLQLPILQRKWPAQHAVNGQGRVFRSSVVAVEPGPNGRAPFSSSTRALAGLVAGWGSARKVNGQGRVFQWPGPLLLLYSGFCGLGRRLDLSRRK